MEHEGLAKGPSHVAAIGRAERGDRRDSERAVKDASVDEDDIVDMNISTDEESENGTGNKDENLVDGGRG